MLGSLFLWIALFNTGIGLSNMSKNQFQQVSQQEILEKLDNILSILGGGNNKNG